MFEWVKRLVGKEREGGLRSGLGKAATGTFGLKLTANGLMVVTSLVLARLLGVTGYGFYSYAMAWASLLGVLAAVGLDKLLVRKVAAYQAQSSWGLMKGLIRWTNQTVFIVSLGVALLVAGVIEILGKPLDSQMVSALWVALFAVPLIALVSLRRAVIRGLFHVITGGMLELLIRPLWFLLMIGCFYLFLREEFSAPWAVGLNVTAWGVAFLIGTQLLYKILPHTVSDASPVYESRAWIRIAAPLMFVGVMQQINTQVPILMLGAIKDAEAVAVYNVARRGAQLITFSLLSVNTALAPTIASLYAAGDMQRLQGVVTKAARIVLLVSLPVAVGLIAFGDSLLSLLFGTDFAQGHVTLVILSVGLLVDAAAGSVVLLLTMTGYERDAAVGLGIMAVLNVILHLVLIPRWGSEGAATASAIGSIIWNLSLAARVYARLGIHSTVLGRINLRTEQ